MATANKMLNFVMFVTIGSAIVMAPAEAFLPYRSRYGDLWDALVDPFSLVESFPSSISREMETLSFAKADWKETSDAHIITIDVPGIKRDEVKIEVEEKRVLRISGERRKEVEQQQQGDNNGEKWHRVERGVGKFVRQFRLPENADMDAIKASLDSGVLTVTVPKISQPIPKVAKVIPIAEPDPADEESRADL